MLEGWTGDGMPLMLGMLFMVSLVFSFVFFFQAEDGIRDYKVTGVQTCALPISRAFIGCTTPISLLAHPIETMTVSGRSAFVSASGEIIPRASGSRCVTRPPSRSKIGRASCRERV